MVEIRTEIDLLDSWFRIADKDGDGRVGGGEAVEFFQRSGLSKEPLFKIWNTVAGNNAYLTKQQFYTSMRLVSAAQRGGGNLSESEARSILIGLGPALPPPNMAGLEGLKTAVPQILSQAAAPASAPMPSPEKSESSGFPPMSGDDVQRYQGLFAQLDADHDGYVLGNECFGTFMQSGLPKEVLRDIWNLVAGSQGQLDKRQFISFLYLMDAVKKGLKMPQSVPSKNFPPLSSDLGADVTVTDILEGHAGQDVFSRQIAVPPLPPKVRYVADAAGELPPSRVPGVDDDSLAGLEYSDRQRLMKERSEAAAVDRSHAKVQAEAEALKKQQAFFQHHLQELTLFKSKTSAALLQAEEWANRERGEATSLQQRYESTYAQAETQFKGSRTLLSDIQAARAKKLELQTRLEALQKDLAQLSNLTPGQLRSENAEIQELNEKIAELEAQLEKQDVRGSALRAAIAKLQDYASNATSRAEEADKDLLSLDRELTILQANFTADDSDHVHELKRLLAVTADTYNSLVEQAIEAGVPLPADAQTKVPPPDLRLEWDDQAAALAADWHDFEDEGFSVVTATAEYSKAAAAAAAKKAIEDAAAARAAAEAEAAAAAEAAEAAEREAEEGQGSDNESTGTHQDMDITAADEDNEADMLGPEEEAMDGAEGASGSAAASPAAADGELPAEQHQNGFGQATSFADGASFDSIGGVARSGGNGNGTSTSGFATSFGQGSFI